MQESSSTIVMSQAKVALTLSNFVLHQISQNKKQKLAEGNLLIITHATKDSTSQEIKYLKMSNSEYTKKIDGCLFVRVKYPKSTSYVFLSDEDQNVLYAVSTPTQNKDIKDLEQQFRVQANLVDYTSAELSNEYKTKIDTHYKDILENQIILNFTTTTKIASAIGKFFGVVSGAVKAPTTQLQSAINEKTQKISNESISTETKSKWQSVKDKAWNLNETVTEIVKPVSQKISNVVNSVAESINTSDNKIIKTIRDFSKETQNSLNQGYNKAFVPGSESKPVHNDSVNDSQMQEKSEKSEADSKFGLV